MKRPSVLVGNNQDVNQGVAEEEDVITLLIIGCRRQRVSVDGLSLS